MTIQKKITEIEVFWGIKEKSLFLQFCVFANTTASDFSIARFRFLSF